VRRGVGLGLQGSHVGAVKKKRATRETEHDWLSTKGVLRQGANAGKNLGMEGGKDRVYSAYRFRRDRGDYKKTRGVKASTTYCRKRAASGRGKLRTSARKCSGRGTERGRAIASFPCNEDRNEKYSAGSCDFTYCVRGGNRRRERMAKSSAL